MPEVSLVAILDADKEGFLRSAGSLIQTIGRAARNLRGKAIMYADSITRSMRIALDETDRRRQKQVEYNLEHGITPKGVTKKITDIMEGARADAEAERQGGGRKGSRRIAEQGVDYATLSPSQLANELRKLEAKMYKHAQNLEFEDAARVRDELQRVKAMGLIG
jgi:excinuclease ABC subunit B